MQISDKEKFTKLYQVFTNAGRFSDDVDERLLIQDLVTTEDLKPFIPKVVKRIVVEALEPNLLIVPNLFTEVNIPTGQMVEIGSIGSVTAGKVSQGGIYPQTNITTDTEGAAVQITVSKYGCAVNISDEAINESQFDVVTLWLRAAGAALARLKESLAIRLVNDMGVTVFDNADPTNSELGVLTGRDISGAQNGTMTLNDLFDLWAHSAIRGFAPDTLIMSPLAWKVFAVDPQLREIVLKGATLATRRMPLGQTPGWGDIFNPAGLGLRYKAEGDEDGLSAYKTTLTPVNSTLNIPPNYLPSPIKVLVSHLVPFTAPSVVGGKAITNIIMADSQRCGILVTKESATPEEADIFERDIHQVKIYERYGMGVFDQGKGIVVARNVIVDRNYIFDNVNSRALNPLDHSTPLV